MFQPLKATWALHLDPDTGNVGFTMASAISLKRLQARHIVVLKLVDEGKPLNQVVTITRQEFAPGWSPILKEIKGDRGQFTVQYLLQRSVGDSDSESGCVVWLVGGPERHGYFRQDEHSHIATSGTTTPALIVGNDKLSS